MNNNASVLMAVELTTTYDVLINNGGDLTCTWVDETKSVGHQGLVHVGYAMMI